MSTRFTTGAMFAILGGFVVVISQAFSPSVAGWVAFGVGASGRDVTWLTFALALGTVGMAFAGLSLNEVANRRLSVGLSNLRWLPVRSPWEPTMQHPRAA